MLLEVVLPVKLVAALRVAGLVGRISLTSKRGGYSLSIRRSADEHVGASHVGRDASQWWSMRRFVCVGNNPIWKVPCGTCC
jgi:hypothetical protein